MYIQVQMFAMRQQTHYFDDNFFKYIQKYLKNSNLKFIDNIIYKKTNFHTLKAVRRMSYIFLTNI